MAKKKEMAQMGKPEPGRICDSGYWAVAGVAGQRRVSSLLRQNSTRSSLGRQWWVGRVFGSGWEQVLVRKIDGSGGTCGVWV